MTPTDFVNPDGELYRDAFPEEELVETLLPGWITQAEEVYSDPDARVGHVYVRAYSYLVEQSAATPDTNINREVSINQRPEQFRYWMSRREYWKGVIQQAVTGSSPSLSATFANPRVSWV